MGRCTAITASGTRCQKLAEGSQALCWTHDPKNASTRSRSASRAARAKPSKEIALLKEELKVLRDDVLEGRVDRNDAAVVVQVYRALLSFIELERRVKETDDLAAELEDLKREYGGA
jgi:hypothetical protein